MATCHLQTAYCLPAGAEAWVQAVCDVGTAAAHAAGQALLSAAAAAVILTSTPAAWASTPTIIRHVLAHRPQAGSLRGRCRLVIGIRLVMEARCVIVVVLAQVSDLLPILL